jgi:uncharacterized protein
MRSEEKARQGLQLLKEAILETVGQHAGGLSNAQIAELLQIHSDFGGKQRDYLSWSVIGLLVNEGKLRKLGEKHEARYVIPRRDSA